MYNCEISTSKLAFEFFCDFKYIQNAVIQNDRSLVHFNVNIITLLCGTFTDRSLCCLLVSEISVNDFNFVLLFVRF